MQKYVIALYIRLSIEDYKYDSLSIENQLLVLNEYAAAMPEYLNAEILEFIDNGYSGTNFERPQVQKLIEMVRANRIDCIFQLAAERNNGTAIARELFRRDIPTPGEYKATRGNHTHDISRTRGIWSPSTVLRILEDERYIGSYVIGKRAVLEVGGTRSRMKDRDKWYIIPDHHPAIVEKSVFEKVQTSQLRFSQPNKKKRDYPLKGKAFCGCCGHALSRTMQKTSYVQSPLPCKDLLGSIPNPLTVQPPPGAALQLHDSVDLNKIAA